MIALEWPARLTSREGDPSIEHREELRFRMRPFVPNGHGGCGTSGTDDIEGGHEGDDEVEMYPDGNSRLTKMIVRGLGKLYHDHVLTGATKNDQYLQDKNTRGHSDHTRTCFSCESSESGDEATVCQERDRVTDDTKKRDKVPQRVDEGAWCYGLQQGLSPCLSH